MEGVEVNPQFWRGKHVFVTGHTGFKGSWLSILLQSFGADVVGFSLPPPTQPNLFTLAGVEHGMQSIVGDVRDFDHVRKVLQQHPAESVFHMAAQALVRHSYADPVGTYATNVLGTVHLLSAVREVPQVKVVVVVTSDKCYQNDGKPQAFRESDPMGGFDPYSSSKGCAELATAAFRSSFFNGGAKSAAALATARAGNVIGGGDWGEDRLIPDLMRAAFEKRVAPIRNPEAVRPWQHVLEPLSGYLLLAEKLWKDGPRFSEGWNFGPREGDAKPVRWVVERCAELWGEGFAWEADTGTHPHEAQYLRLDCTRARTKLGWQPRWDVTQALSTTLAWYKIAQRSQQDARELLLEQIGAYQAPVAAGKV
jgi:CDP-glucose 4,6-dehydratase